MQYIIIRGDEGEGCSKRASRVLLTEKRPCSKEQGLSFCQTLSRRARCRPAPSCRPVSEDYRISIPSRPFTASRHPGRRS